MVFGVSLPDLATEALIFALAASSDLYTTRRGKFIVWAGLLDGLAVRGNQRLLDVGCGRHESELCPVDLCPGLDRGPSGIRSEGRAHVESAMRFSPIDPLDYAMMGTRAFALMLAGDNAEAAGWAERAACSSRRLKQSCTAPRGWLTASLARGLAYSARPQSGASRPIRVTFSRSSQDTAHSTYGNRPSLGYHKNRMIPGVAFVGASVTVLVVRAEDFVLRTF